MKSTAQILDIVDKYGEDQKPELMRELKALRMQVKREVLRAHTNTTRLINLMYK